MTTQTSPVPPSASPVGGSAHTPFTDGGSESRPDCPVPARRRWTIVMIICAIMMNLAEDAYTSSYFEAMGMQLGYLWTAVGLLFAFVTPIMLRWRERRPELVSLAASASVLLLPFSPTVSLFGLCGVWARRSDRRILGACTAASLIVMIVAHVRDIARPADYSLWGRLFAKPGTGVNGVPAVVDSDLSSIVVAAVVWSVCTFAAAILSGLHLRSRAYAQAADVRMDVERNRANVLENDLNTQRFADAVAAEAHDTLAHSLSLIAVNASALQAEALKLSRDPRYAGAESDTEAGRNLARLAERAGDIRRQAAGALDEAHSIIGMLRHPQQAQILLMPDSDTALTREALYAVIDDARDAGMTLDTWIDIRELSSLDVEIGKIAFRGIQEGLTNARRHAPGARVALEISAEPKTGVNVRFTNPTVFNAVNGMGRTSLIDHGDGMMPENESDDTKSGGNGLPGLKARVLAVGGDCQYGYDERNDFHLDFRLPFARIR
ncbi:sensor histidine kinase [Bifidobacterium callimiconis]|uniref:sensor histidine kinase n=1 Tax=Bifidobacterium callimiconis TaxID=2306973 RepID=UPI001BDC3FF2|nr:histidine kinase [Bifidobacterium callimiconis]MBT1176801.1 sensor histidine kinase [Bifidobacterium callimiconis]